MENAKNDTQAEWTPPYIPWTKIPKLIQQLESDRPPRIDRTVLTGSNQVRSQTFNALVSLGLIREDGSYTEVFDHLIKDPEDRVGTVRGLLQHLYPEPIELGRTNGTQLQLDQAFGKYRASGSTRRKAIGFFLNAAEYAEIPMSPHFKVPSVPRKSAPRKTARKGKKPDGGDVPPPSKDSPTISSLRARYIEMLMKKVDTQDDLDDPLLDRIERLLDFPEEETPQ